MPTELDQSFLSDAFLRKFWLGHMLFCSFTASAANLQCTMLFCAAKTFICLGVHVQYIVCRQHHLSLKGNIYERRDSHITRVFSILYKISYHNRYDSLTILGRRPPFVSDVAVQS